MRRARLISARAGEQPGALLARSGLADEARPVLVVCAGAGTHPLSSAVWTAANRAGAAVATHAGNEALARALDGERAGDPAATIVGVAAPAAADGLAGDGTAQQGFTHIIVAGEDWGDEPLLAGVAASLAGGSPIVLVLAGGDDSARADLRHALRRGWPVFAMAGSGGLADQVAAAASGRGTDAGLADELRGRDVRVAGPGPEALARMLAWELQDAPALKAAWALFATYDGLANGLRDTYKLFQAAVLVLGVVATAIALLHDVAREGLLRDALHWGAVAAPIGVSLLIALANRRRSGNRWVLLRGAAEAIKSEIYRCRTRTGAYAPAAPGDPPVDRERRLNARLADIDERLGQTAASDGTLTPYSGPLPPKMYGAAAGDDGLSELGAARYVEIRLADQLVYYRDRVGELDRLRSRFQLVTLAAGGAGALLAAAGAEIWIGLTTAIAGAALAYLGNLQVDSTIVSYNQAAAQLGALERDFGVDREADTDLGRLVAAGEEVLTQELGGWVQQMTQTLERQREEKRKSDDTSGGETPPTG